MKVRLAPSTLISFMAFALIGCAAQTIDNGPGSQPSGGLCDADPAQYALSQKVSNVLAAKLKKQTGAAVLRWIPVGSAITMDYRVERLNIHYGRDMRITKIDCG